MQNPQNGIELKADEKLEDLQCGGLFIIQSEKLYRFTSDSVALANFAKVKKNGIVADLGTGSGVIAVLFSAKTEAQKIYGVEIQPELADMARRSVAYNALNDKIEIMNVDLKDVAKILGNECADTVVCNPPYEKANQQLCENPSVAACNAEIYATFDDFAVCAKKLLKFGGKFYAVIKAKRLADAIFALKQNGLEPKEIVLLAGKDENEADSALIYALKGGKTELKIKIGRN